jgi:pseudaminic acid synthase
MIKKISIGKRVISDSNIPLVVAEISANHQNSLKKTIELLKKASKANVEAVKFQTFDLNEMTFDLNKKEFLIKKKFNNKKWNSRSLFSIYKEAQFPLKWHRAVFKKAKSLGLICFSSVFDIKSLIFLEKLNCPAYKIASLESLHFPLIEAVIKTKKPVIISTGTLNLKEIDLLINFLKKIRSKKHIILHCVSDYPTKNENVNLKFISFLKKKYNCLVGFSDHTPSLGAAIASVSYGASIIEKHLKLSKFDKSLDQQFSITPSEMKTLIAETNNAWRSQGQLKKKITTGELFVKKYRRSIYASKSIKKGEIFTGDNLKVIRPGYGLEPSYYNKILGKKAKKNIKFGEPVKLKSI